MIVSVDFEQDTSNQILGDSGKSNSNLNGLEFIETLESLGAGEILLQSIQRDGTLSGMDFKRIELVSALTKLPVIASGGAASLNDFQKAVLSGASAVAAGALFQFTSVTPKEVRRYLADQGVRTRITG